MVSFKDLIQNSTFYLITAAAECNRANKMILLNWTETREEDIVQKWQIYLLEKLIKTWIDLPFSKLTLELEE